jgi:NhaP-type Na+/H+ or K+/H+ antiporter
MKTLFERIMEHLKDKVSHGAAGSIGLFGVGSLPEVVEVNTTLLFFTQKDVIFVLQSCALLASIFVAILTSVAWFEKRRESRKKVIN